jgi:four helix bundle protein
MIGYANHFYFKRLNTEELLTRTKKFAISIIRLSKSINDNLESRIIRNQLIRSGTSVGANYRAAIRARSQKEFFAKLSIVVEEADEVLYWLELLEETGEVSGKITKEVYSEGLELLKIFSKTRKTVSLKIKSGETNS